VTAPSSSDLPGGRPVAAPAIRIERLAVIGLGLIGGSFALALRRAGAVGRIIGAGRSAKSAAEALEHGLVDEIAAGPGEAVEGADFVLVATPVGQMEAVFAAIAPRLSPQAVVTDGGSTKRDVVAAARRALGPALARFVPGHPVAGAERSGPSAAQAGLYEGRRVVLTPLPENRAESVERVAAAWRACGARVHSMDTAEHDRVLAAVSHLPHVLAYALVETVISDPRAELLWEHAAGGFRDFTRIASSHPEMWRDICLANRDLLVEEIDRYREQLERLRGMIDRGEAAALEDLFRRSASARNAWLERFNARARNSA